MDNSIQNISAGQLAAIVKYGFDTASRYFEYIAVMSEYEAARKAGLDLPFRLSDVRMPNGKTLKECTGGELREIGETMTNMGNVMRDADEKTNGLPLHGAS